MSGHERALLLAVIRAEIAPIFAGGRSPQAVRADFEAHFARRRPPAWLHAKPVIVGGVPGEWVRAADAADDGVVLTLHGGCYAVGSCNTERELAGWLSRAVGVRALTIDYRLAPEHPFPAGLDDALAAYRWLLGQGITPEQIAFAGISAGGGLTLATLVALRDAGEPLPAGAVLISPWTDLACRGASYETRADADPVLTQRGLAEMAAHYLPGRDPRTPLASPIYADLHGLPPLLIDVGDDEILLDDAVGVAERARAMGVDVTLNVWPGMFHVFHGAASILPEARQALDGIGEFIRHRFASGTQT
jgi:monoterpene epsilon-lactone hydrolase